MSVNPQAKAQELGLAWPTPPRPVADYISAVVSGGHVYVSGQLPMADGELLAKGPVPDEVSLDQAQAAARQCAVNALGAVGSVIDGDWTRLVKAVRLGVFVHSSPGFDQQHQVANGASELLGELLGEAGKHARAAVGVPSLPLGASVEVELIVEIA